MKGDLPLGRARTLRISSRLSVNIAARNSAARRCSASKGSTTSNSNRSGKMRCSTRCCRREFSKASKALGGGRQRSMTATVAVVPSSGDGGRSARRSRTRWMTVVWGPGDMRVMIPAAASRWQANT